MRIGRWSELSFDRVMREVMLMRHLANSALHLAELLWAIPVKYTKVRYVD